MKYSTELLAELELLIGKRCYNPNSVDGYNGQAGKWFRYPVWMKEDGQDTEKKCAMKATLSSANEVSSLRYKFGSNHLYIGEALVDLLGALEERYDISFDELEEELGG